MLDFKTAEIRAMQWLLYAHEHHGQGGFPHSRWIALSNAFAWKSDYAETTGYLLENLLEFNHIEPERQKAIANICGDWLLRIQSKDGFFHAGVQYKKSSSFNTAQILGGLDVLYRNTNQKSYLEALEKAFSWLVHQIHPTGYWTSGLYVKNYFSVYYARALWLLIKMDKLYFDETSRTVLQKSFDWITSKAEKSFYSNSSFFPGKSSISHNLIYALEGLFECGVLLENASIIDWVDKKMQHFNKLSHETQTLPGKFNASGVPSFSNICVCGQAQAVSLNAKLYLHQKDNQYLMAARRLMSTLISWQKISEDPEHNGAFPSSIPIWGSYFPLRYVNWNNKFFLDACYYLRQAESIATSFTL